MVFFFKRKNGEFNTGEKYKYILPDQIIDISVLVRVAYSVFGDPSKARRSGE